MTEERSRIMSDLQIALHKALASNAIDILMGYIENPESILDISNAVDHLFRDLQEKEKYGKEV